MHAILLMIRFWSILLGVSYLVFEKPAYSDLKNPHKKQDTVACKNLNIVTEM